MATVKFPEITVELIGQDGNIFNLMGIVGRALKENGKGEFVEEFYADVKSASSYDMALVKIMSWVNVEWKQGVHKCINLWTKHSVKNTAKTKFINVRIKFCERSLKKSGHLWTFVL